MFKTMKSAELLTVNGGGHYVPKYNFYNQIVGSAWADNNVKYYWQDKNGKYYPRYY